MRAVVLPEAEQATCVITCNPANATPDKTAIKQQANKAPSKTSSGVLSKPSHFMSLNPQFVLVLKVGP